MNKEERYKKAEKLAKDELCNAACLCPKIRAAGACDSCAVLASLREYYATAEVGILDDYSWDEIADISATGNAAEKFSIGDEKTCTLYTGEEVTFVILGFNHDKLQKGGLAGITFGLKELMDGRFEMNADDTNVGGWRDSKMRTVYMERIYKLLPDELRKHIKTAIKLTGEGDCSEDAEQTADKLFLFSEKEVFGTTEYAVSNEGKQYPYFKDASNRIKHRNVTSASHWWLRSPYASTSNYFCYVYYGGYVNGNFASNSYGVCFGFCL